MLHNNLRVVLAAALLLIGGAATWWLARGGRAGAYRVGPWPGLTARGAGVLLACALLLGGVEGWLGEPRTAWPDLAALATALFVPLALATRIVAAPGAASAVCGAYLLPRSLVSLLDASVEPPPLVLVGAIVFDLVLWVRRDDLARRRRRRRKLPPRNPSARRGAVAGGAYALAFMAVEPAYVALLGGPELTPAAVLPAAVASAAACAAIGAATRIGRDTG